MIESIKEFNPQTQLTYKEEKENVVIINPNIETLEPNTNNSYLEDIISGYEIYTINRSDIILKEKLNSLKAIYNQINTKTPFSNYYLDEIKLKILN